MDKYFWNFNKDEEVWRNSEISIEACIEEARLNAEGEKEVVYIGESENHVPSIDAERIIDGLTEQAYDECGESSEGWLDGAETEELEEKLNVVLKEWLKKTNQQPSFGRFKEIYCYDLKTGERVII